MHVRLSTALLLRTATVQPLSLGTRSQVLRLDLIKGFHCLGPAEHSHAGRHHETGTES